jgi:hypothetical protein
VLDLTGRKVFQLMNEIVDTGEIARTFTTADLPSGSYVIQVNMGGAISSYRFSVAH